jgi:hypothetical protein
MGLTDLDAERCGAAPTRHGYSQIYGSITAVVGIGNATQLRPFATNNDVQSIFFGAVR